MSLLSKKKLNTTLIIVSTFYLGFMNYKVYNSIGNFKLGIDDAHIFFVYAENFRDGFGFKYSNGIPTTEGYSSPIWMLISVFSFLLRLDEVGMLMVVFTLQIFSLLSVWIITNIYFNNREAKYVYLFWLTSMLLFPGYWTWNGFSLMENSLVTLWQLVTLIVILKSLENRASLLLLFLTAFVRIELFVVIITQILTSLLFFKDKPAIKRTIKYLTSACIGLLSITFLRLITYGQPLPNTYYAKVSPDLQYRFKQGMFYVEDYFKSDQIRQVSFIVFFGLLVFLSSELEAKYSLTKIFNRKRRSSKISQTKFSKSVSTGLLANMYFVSERRNVNELFVFCLTNFVVTILLAIAKGGDHFREFRLFSSSLPLQVLGILVITAAISKKLMTLFFSYLKLSWLFSILIVFVLVSTLVYGKMPGSQALEISKSVTKTLERKSLISEEFQIANVAPTYKILERIRLSSDRSFSIGIITGGVSGRNYKGRIFDLTGLNYEAIAQNGGNRIGFFGHSALEFKDFVKLPIDFIPENIPGGIDFFLRGLTRQEFFHQKYSFGKLCTKNKECVFGYLNKEWKNLDFEELSTFDKESNSWRSYNNDTFALDQNSECSALANLLIGILTGRNLLASDPVGVLAEVEIRDKGEISRLAVADPPSLLCTGKVQFLVGLNLPILFYSDKGLIWFKLAGQNWQT